MKLSTLKSIRSILGKSGNIRNIPILNCFKITKEFLYFTDLEVQVRVRHFFPIKGESDDIVIRSDHFLQRMEHIKAPFFISCIAGKNIAFHQPGGVSTLRNEDLSKTDFPAIYLSDGMQPVFTVTAHELMYMDIASQFVADDFLRPVMQTVCVGADFVVASDAHILYYRKIGIHENIEVLFDKRVIKLMMLFPGQSFQIGKAGKNVFAVSDDITICWRGDNNEHLDLGLVENQLKSKYPNWKKVLPEVTHTVIIPVKETIAALKSIKFALNSITGMTRIVIDGNKLTVTGRNSDEDLLASESVPIVNADNHSIEFGMKHAFLSRILKCFHDEGYLQVSMGYLDSTRAFVFNDQILCMPMVINE